MIPREPLDTGVVGKRELSEEIFRSNLAIDSGGRGKERKMGQMGNTVTDPRVFQGQSNARKCTNLYYTFSVCVCACLELLDKNAYEAPTPQL